MKNSHWLAIIIPTLFLLPYCTQPNPELYFSKIQNEIQRIMDEQKAAWNAGSVEGFMKFYWKTDDFIFQGGNRRLQGWDELLAMYKKNYSGENMGKLDFTDVEIHVISEKYAYVLGRWQVILKDSLKEGLFTLIFKKFDTGWRIIVDHSS
jgi:uncharacterized protein (TIGR02246 family)